jgi:hypothetical protein
VLALGLVVVDPLAARNTLEDHGFFMQAAGGEYDSERPAEHFG